MKIAYLFDAIYPYHKGGKEKRLHDLSTNFSNMGHDVHIYTMNWWGGEKIKKENGLTLHAISKHYPLYKGKIRSIKQGLMFGLNSFKLIKEDFDLLDSDHMVYFHLFPAWLVCKLRGKPFVITWNEVWGKDYWISYMGKKGIFGYIIEKLSSKLPDKIVSISDLTTNNLIQKLNVSKDKILTVPNWIDFSNIQKIKPSKVKSDIIFAGRLLSHKNVDLLINAVHNIKKSSPKIKCIVIGEGPELSSLINQVKKLKLEKNVLFKGFLDNHNDVLSLIKSSKVFVLPSEREGFGIVVIEANACGVPVIALEHKDNASKYLVVKGQNGHISNKDPLDLAEKILLAIKNHKSMRAHCLSEAKRFDWPQAVSKFQGVYGK